MLAGGHSLIPMMKLRLAQPPALVDVGRVAELSGIRATGADTIVVGALTRHAEIAASELLRAACPLLAEAAGKIGDPQVRNRGTIGGNIAHADPASDLPAVLVALAPPCSARPAASGRCRRRTSSSTCCPPTCGRGSSSPPSRCRALAAGTGSGYLKVEHPASGYAVCGAAAWSRFDGGSCTGGGLAFNGVTAMPVDGSAVGAALVGGAADDAAIAAAVAGHLRSTSRSATSTPPASTGSSWRRSTAGARWPPPATGRGAEPPVRPTAATPDDRSARPPVHRRGPGGPPPA